MFCHHISNDIIWHQRNVALFGNMAMRSQWLLLLLFSHHTSLKRWKLIYLLFTYASFPINTCQWLTILISLQWPISHCLYVYRNFSTSALFVCYYYLWQYMVSLLTIHKTQTQTQTQTQTRPKQPSILVENIDWQSNKWLIDWSAARRIYDIVECLRLIMGPEKLSNVTIIYHLFYKISYRTLQSFFL